MAAKTSWHRYGTKLRHCQLYVSRPSVLWRCWLGGRKGIRPVKTEWWGTGVVICLERGADLHMAQLMPLPLTVSCFSEIQIGFTFLVPAHPGSPGQRAVKRMCVCVCVCVFYYFLLRVVTLQSVLEVTFFYLRHSEIDWFTLHYRASIASCGKY